MFGGSFKLEYGGKLPLFQIIFYIMLRAERFQTIFVQLQVTCIG